jgi:hypothetical protein
MQGKTVLCEHATPFQVISDTFALAMLTMTSQTSPDVTTLVNPFLVLVAVFVFSNTLLGISTQSVVENMLWRRQGKTRHDLGRKKLVETIWEWKGEYHERINRVLRRLGGSLDWSREAFTMDDNLSTAVTETFCRLHEEGLIYR